MSQRKSDRVRVRDLDSCIFIPNKNKSVEQKLFKKEVKETTVFTMFGFEDALNEDSYPVLKDTEDELAEDRLNACAKIVKGSTTKYYVKRGTHGRMLNLIGMYDENNKKRMLKQKGREEFIYSQVNKRVFNIYLSFLKTKNVARLKLAEREAL